MERGGGVDAHGAGAYLLVFEGPCQVEFRHESYEDGSSVGGQRSLTLTVHRLEYFYIEDIYIYRGEITLTSLQGLYYNYIKSRS